MTACPPRQSGRRRVLRGRIADVAAFCFVAIIAAAGSWLVYWLAAGAIFQPGVHPDYWPGGLIVVIWGLAALTGLAIALLLFRPASPRGGR